MKSGERKSKKREAQLQFPRGKPDLEALRAVTRGWLAPRLAQEFLREKNFEVRPSGPAPSRSTDSCSSEESDTALLNERTRGAGPKDRRAAERR